MSQRLNTTPEMEAMLDITHPVNARTIRVTYLNIDGSERSYNDDISASAKDAWALCAKARNTAKVIKVVESITYVEGAR